MLHMLYVLHARHVGMKQGAPQCLDSPLGRLCWECQALLRVAGQGADRRCRARRWGRFIFAWLPAALRPPVSEWGAVVEVRSPVRFARQGR